MSKYTREILGAAAADSVSVLGVIRALGLRPAGGTHSYISKRLQVLDIDTSHFTGQSHGRGSSSARRKPASAILTADGAARRPKTNELRRALIEIGRELKCAKCGLSNEWQEEVLTLEIDHIDGDWTNNLETNLRFLCPNCHSQCKETNRPNRHRLT
jgi:hypothetical protein